MSRVRSRSRARRLWVSRSTGNMDSTRSLLHGVILAAAAAAQGAAPPLEVDFEADPSATAGAPDCSAFLSAFLRAAAARLRAAGDSGDVQPGSATSGVPLSGPLLAFLWLGDAARADALLAREAAAVPSGGDDAT